MRRFFPFNVSKVFQPFIIVFLFAFVCIGILGSGQAFATGSSFNVPHVNDHFEKVQQGPTPTKEKAITTDSSKSNKPSLWDRFTATCKDAWNWTKQTAVHLWNKGKELYSKHKWLTGFFIMIAIIRIQARFSTGFWKGVWDARRYCHGNNRYVSASNQYSQRDCLCFFTPCPD
ncbi:hypothetical protein H1164_16235 [Thermoactinomyces daqus]|uniref:Uncharacterized protein n=1 Tax=Thermoactinomyces daqus TaxID=1329516 RepID=A0A7W2AJH4_9BACL|nr:hypothetical protein [Thermoactinomyces daqus]MBA4544395.1 hypothetical protein [Thermoactinomyces daqus]